MIKLFKSLFSKPTETTILVKRNFDNVPWRWNTGDGIRTHHCFHFSNGLGLIVFKESNGTFDGMEAVAVEQFNPNGSFKILQVPEVRFYNRRGGIGVEEVEQFKKEIRLLRRYTVQLN